MLLFLVENIVACEATTLRAVHVLQTVDVERFWDSMIAAILKADMLSPLNISKNSKE